MSTSLITGYANGPHVTSKQQGACNAASFTAGKYVLNIGECFAYELVSNNLIRVKEGMAINQGRYMCIDRNDYEELTIDNGLQGVKRSDLIVIRYEKNQNTGIETATMMVIKGTSGDSYVDPEHQEGNILEGDLIDDLLLYRVNLNGLNVESVEVLFNMKDNMDSIEEKIGSTDISGIGDGTFTGGLAALNNSLQTVKYTKIDNANSSIITELNGYIVKQGNVRYMIISFKTTSSRASGALFRFPEYLAPNKVSVNGLILDNNLNVICGFTFPTQSSSNYNSGYIKNLKTLPVGSYIIQSCWIDE